MDVRPAPGTYVDVHQHLWPEPLIEALRARPRPPMLRGWTLILDGEPPYQVSPADHDVDARQAPAAGPPNGGEYPARPQLALVSLSSPLGLEDLPVEQAAVLLE